MSDSALPPTITGKDILEMLNAPTQYNEFKQFAESGALCSPKYNPAFRGRGKDDELGIRMKDNLHIYEKQIHPRLQIGNYFLMMLSKEEMANPSTTMIRPTKNTKLWLCQVYEAIGYKDNIKLWGEI